MKRPDSFSIDPLFSEALSGTFIITNPTPLAHTLDELVEAAAQEGQEIRKDEESTTFRYCPSWGLGAEVRAVYSTEPDEQRLALSGLVLSDRDFKLTVFRATIPVGQETLPALVVAPPLYGKELVMPAATPNIPAARDFIAYAAQEFFDANTKAFVESYR